MDDSKEYLVSPVTGYRCRRITCQNVKQFGFDSVLELKAALPTQLLIANDLASLYKDERRKGSVKSAAKQQARADSKRATLRCQTCGGGITTKHQKKFCSRSCSTVARNKTMDRSKQHDALRKKFTDAYENNPSFCTSCSGAMIYKERHRVFCSSCADKKVLKGERVSVSYRPDPVKKERKCSCGTPLNFAERKCLSCKEPRRQQANLTCVCGQPKSSATKKYCGKCKTNVSHYRTLCEFKFNVFDYPDDFELDLIAKFGWYSPNGYGSRNKTPNLDGCSRDHIYNVSDGFREHRDPALLAHPANCRIMKHNGENGNNSKKKSLITWDDLLARIANWEATH